MKRRTELMWYAMLAMHCYVTVVYYIQYTTTGSQELLPYLIYITSLVLGRIFKV